MNGELFRFGPFELDPAAETLRRSGLAIRIPPQPFRILLLLVRRAGEVVTREELHAAIWGDATYVDFEHGINSAIRSIRYALGDQAETPRYVRTLPRRGYLFIAAVEPVARAGKDVPPPAAVVPPSPAPASRSRIKPRLAAIAATAVVAITAMAALIAESRRDEKSPTSRSIAVPAFRRLGPPVEGLDRSFAEELRANVGTLAPAHVSLSMRPEADVVLHGTIREEKDEIRVIVSAVDTRSQTQLWSETYQRPVARKEGMAVEVAHRVTQELAHRFVPPARHEPVLETKARPSAVALYKQARALRAVMEGYDWRKAKEFYEAALREEPQFAEAWSGLSDVWATQLLNGPAAGRNEAATRAADCVRRALALQPRNVEAIANRGLLAAYFAFDLPAAERDLRLAVSMDPGYADARGNLAMVLAMRGLDESLREWTAARQLDPAGLDLSVHEPFLYLQARRYEDARARYREILAVYPDCAPAIWGLLFTHIARKDWSEAIAHARTFPAAAKLDLKVPATEAGFVELYSKFEAFMEEGRRKGDCDDYFLAAYYAHIGRSDRAFELLNRAVDARLFMVSFLLVDPRFDNLRGDPRFRTLLGRLKLT